MNKYGDVAVRATELLRNGRCSSPNDAWQQAVTEFYPDSSSSQKKGCPKGAYLGLCEEGRVIGISRGAYTRSIDNKKYALAAATLLQSNPMLAEAGPTVLWDRVMDGRKKKSNAQMEVVLALFESRLLNI